MTHAEASFETAQAPAEGTDHTGAHGRESAVRCSPPGRTRSGRFRATAPPAMAVVERGVAGGPGRRSAVPARSDPDPRRGRRALRPRSRPPHRRSRSRAAPLRPCTDAVPGRCRGACGARPVGGGGRSQRLGAVGDAVVGEPERPATPDRRVAGVDRAPVGIRALRDADRRLRAPSRSARLPRRRHAQRIRHPRLWGPGHARLRLRLGDGTARVGARRAADAAADACDRPAPAGAPAGPTRVQGLHPHPGHPQHVDRPLRCARCRLRGCDRRGRRFWVLRPDRQPTPWSGRYLVVVDTLRDARPDWNPLPGAAAGSKPQAGA